jgi:GT2 family glycosyltransferase
MAPDIRLVQFIDGDCELLPEWIAAATRHLRGNSACAVVCGRLRERYPEASPYNLLCDMEWDGPVGEIEACGGIALMRVSAFEQVQGFREDLIAGEEPELCVRLRQAGWRIERIPVDMAWHDAAMTRFGQWARRAMRAGFAFAQGAWLHGAPPERHGVKQMRSALVWGLFIPIMLIALIVSLGPSALLLLLVYPAQWLRIVAGETRAPRDNALRALFLMLGKFPEVAGVLKFHIERLQGRTSHLIEYK